jgi:hypothetical protein
MPEATFIQDENIFILLGVEIFMPGLIYWVYKSDKKQKEKDYEIGT